MLRLPDVWPGPVAVSHLLLVLLVDTKGAPLGSRRTNLLAAEAKDAMEGDAKRTAVSRWAELGPETFGYPFFIW